MARTPESPSAQERDSFLIWDFESLSQPSPRIWPVLLMWAIECTIQVMNGIVMHHWGIICFVNIHHLYKYSLASLPPPPLLPGQDGELRGDSMKSTWTQDYHSSIHLLCQNLPHSSIPSLNLAMSGKVDAYSVNFIMWMGRAFGKWWWWDEMGSHWKAPIFPKCMTSQLDWLGPSHPPV